MKVIIATVTISSALVALQFTPAFAQARGGGAAAGASGAAAAGGSGTAAVSAGGAAKATAGSPTGNLAGRPGVPSALQGPALNAPAGAAIATPGTATPAGRITPGSTAVPPAATGRTFDRATIGGGPTETIVDPNSRQPVFRFPPASTLPQPVLPNLGVGAAGEQLGSGLPDSRTFPPGLPVGVANTVGTNFGRVFTNTARQPVVVDLPPGAVLTTNRFGVTEALVPPPVVVPNSVGRGPTFESSSARRLEAPQRTAPPRNPSVVNPR